MHKNALLWKMTIITTVAAQTDGGDEEENLKIGVLVGNALCFLSVVGYWY